MVDALQGAVPLPKVEVAVHGAARDQILGKSPFRRYSTGFAVGTLSDFAHWQPVLRIYIRPLTTSRMSTVRLLPPRLAGGMGGATNAHSSSVRSLG